MEKLCHAAKLHIEPYWFGLFAKALKSADVGSLVSSVGSASAGPAVAAPAAVCALLYASSLRSSLPSEPGQAAEIPAQAWR